MARKAANKHAGRFVLESDLTIYQVLELKDLILAALGGTDELEIDLAAVSEIDGAGLQLMVMLKQEANRLEKGLRFISHTPSILELLELCDLSSFFGDPLVLPSKRH